MTTEVQIGAIFGQYRMIEDKSGGYWTIWEPNPYLEMDAAEQLAHNLKDPKFKMSKYNHSPLRLSVDTSFVAPPSLWERLFGRV